MARHNVIQFILGRVAHVIIRWRWVVPGKDSNISLANEVRANDKRGYEIDFCRGSLPSSTSQSD